MPSTSPRGSPIPCADARENGKRQGRSRLGDRRNVGGRGGAPGTIPRFTLFAECYDRVLSAGLLHQVNREGTLTRMSTTESTSSKTIFWHRDLPPFNAEAMGEHTVEATSGRVPGTMEHRSELWDRCYADLMAQTRLRIAQEVDRLGGDYAHVLEESVDSRHDDRTGETWLHGRFSYVLYRRPPQVA